MFLHKSKLTLALVIICLLAGLNSAAAQSRSAKPTGEIVAGEIGAKADELLTRYAMYGFSGSVLIIKHDQIVFNKAYGLADRERGRRNEVDTLYDIGSIAKTFTAAAILQLETRGKLKTSDLISKYLGGFPSDKATITIHHLLTHTSGFPADAVSVGINPSTSPDEFFQKVKTSPLLFQPGEKYSYSNLGYGLLAIIIEKLSGQTWQDYLRKNLIKPAGLKRAHLYGDVLPETVARGYIGDLEETVELEQPLALERPDSRMWRKYIIGSGGVITSTGELYQWWKALHSDKVLSKEARQKMFSLQFTNQGYGWNIQNPKDGIERIYRGGLRGSYQALLAHYPKEDVLLIYGMNKNVTSISALWSGVTWRNLERLITGQPFVVPPAIASASIEPTLLQKYVGNYESPSESGFIVSIENGSLSIGAVGQKAINFLAYPQQKPTSMQQEVSDAGKQMILWLSKDDLSEAQRMGMMGITEATQLIAKWKSWMRTIGKLESFQVLGVSPGTGNNPRAFVRVNGDRSSLVLRFLFDWKQKRFLGSGDNILLPAVTPLKPESETSFVNFDFDRSRLVRLRFNVASDGSVTGLTIVDSEHGELVATKTEKKIDSTVPTVAVSYVPKEDPAPTAATIRPEAADAAKYADYIGRFSTARGVVTFKVEGTKFIGEAGGSNLSLVADSTTKDRFYAERGAERVTFERDAKGKVVGVTVINGQGHEIKGTKIN